MPVVELNERRGGFEKLKAAFKALTDKLCTEGGPNYFYQCGRAMKLLLLQNDSLAAEIETAKSLTERLAVEAREKEVSHRYCNMKSTGAIPSLESLKRNPDSIKYSVSSPRHRQK